MLISEIKDVRLRKLAELRRSERDMNGDYAEFSDVLDNAFEWSKAEEGDEFWGDVNFGHITELEEDRVGLTVNTLNDPLGLLQIN